jgi:hypothetical protein
MAVKFNPLSGTFDLVGGGGSSGVAWGDITGTLADQTDLSDALNDITDSIVALDAEVDLKANLASPTFTGSVVVPDAANANEAASKGQVDTALALKANLASPSFTGTVSNSGTFRAAPAVSNVYGFTTTNAGMGWTSNTYIQLRSHVGVVSESSEIQMNHGLSSTAGDYMMKYRAATGCGFYGINSTQNPVAFRVGTTAQPNHRWATMHGREHPRHGWRHPNSKILWNTRGHRQR